VLAALARDGARVTLCICTDGARGSLADADGLAAPALEAERPRRRSVPRRR
jgi:LmbE family N-acetylglucosaminyl deacetylase